MRRRLLHSTAMENPRDEIPAGPRVQVEYSKDVQSFASFRKTPLCTPGFAVSKAQGVVGKSVDNVPPVM